MIFVDIFDFDQGLINFDLTAEVYKIIQSKPSREKFTIEYEKLIEKAINSLNELAVVFLNRIYLSKDYHVLAIATHSQLNDYGISSSEIIRDIFNRTFYGTPLENCFFDSHFIIECIGTEQDPKKNLHIQRIKNKIQQKHPSEELVITFFEHNVSIAQSAYQLKIANRVVRLATVKEGQFTFNPKIVRDRNIQAMEQIAHCGLQDIGKFFLQQVSYFSSSSLSSASLKTPLPAYRKRLERACSEKELLPRVKLKRTISAP